MTGTLDVLSPAQRQILAKAEITDADSALLTPLEDLAKKCRASLAEVQAIITTLCTAHDLDFRSLDEIDLRKVETISSGDEGVDACIGGGFKTGMVWDICGESGAGKTQLALQLSLLVQIPKNLGGLLGSACYITTNAELATKRLVELSKHHILLSPSICSLDNVRTMRISSPDMLIHVLADILPQLITSHQSHTSKPVKVVILDSLTALFRLAEKTSTSTLTERAKKITEISKHLHSLASTHGLAIIVLNEVTDAFHRSTNVPADGNDRGEVSYHEQAQLFNRADTIPGENRKEAGLGLAWANQPNVRIMMSKTGRRRYLADEVRSAKRTRLDLDGNSSQPSSSEEPLLLRRFSVIFSSVAQQASIDYIVTREGIVTINEEEAPPPPTIPPTHHFGSDDPVFGAPIDQIDQVPSSSLDNELSALRGDDPVTVDDDEDQYWEGFEDLEDTVLATEQNVNPEQGVNHTL